MSEPLTSKDRFTVAFEAIKEAYSYARPTGVVNDILERALNVLQSMPAHEPATGLTAGDIERYERMFLIDPYTATRADEYARAGLHMVVALRSAPPPSAGLLEQLKAYMLDQEWHKRCEIIPDYMPPHPSKGTRPTVQIRYNDGSEHPPFLRHSAGPKQGFFWDIYGDDMQNIPLAIIALSQAPYPRAVGPIVFKVPFRSAPTKELSL